METQKHIVTQLGIIEADDTRRLNEAVEWERNWTEDGERTYRYAGGESESGAWHVCADNRAQNPTDSVVLSTHSTEAEATAEADRLNEAIDAEILGEILTHTITLPSDVESVKMGGVQRGSYPLSRHCTIQFRVQHQELGPLDFEWTCYWSAETVTDSALSIPTICATIQRDYASALGVAVTLRRAELENVETT